MPRRRILSLWFPRLAAERLLRRMPEPDRAFATVAEIANAQRLESLSPAAAAAGLRPGQALRDALALCPDLASRPADPAAERAFLGALRRWAGRFSPWVAEDLPDGLMLDITGCAHLFGGEGALLARAEEDCTGFGLTLRAGLADTPGAAWALARHAGQGAASHRSGDMIDQEARATRSRAARRHWTRGGPAPRASVTGTAERVAPPDHTHSALAPLPVAALRLAPETVDTLARLGLRRIGDLSGMPRATLARRFGAELTRRLDQAFGLVPEPLSPAPPDIRFAVRLTLPEPIGRTEDILAGIDRLLPPLAAKLATAGRGARRVRLELLRSDHSRQALEVGLARPTRDPDRIRPLLALKLDAAEAGFGIDALRLAAPLTEPLAERQQAGHADAGAAARARQAAGPGLDDLIARLGTRIGLDAITYRHPADSHIPEKTAHRVAAAWADPAAGGWPEPPAPRPLTLFPPEPVTAAAPGQPPAAFRWRRRAFRVAAATGPARITPEWWLDDPAWRSGPRDYWQVDTEEGARLWLFRAHGGLVSGGWFCHGDFG